MLQNNYQNKALLNLKKLRNYAMLKYRFSKTIIYSGPGLHHAFFLLEVTKLSF